MRKPFRVWQDVYAIGGADISHPYDCCVYLVASADELVLIDSGAGESAELIVDNIESLGFDPRKLTIVLTTHAHIDHIGALAEFKKKYGVKVIAHELDALAIETGRRIGAEAYGIPYTPCKVDMRLKEAEATLPCGRHEIKVVHIPGHTPGSIAAYVDMAGKRVLFGQDIHGPYYAHWGADIAKARDSLQKLLSLRADILCEGHFGIYQPATEVEKYIKGYLRNLEP